MDLFSHVIFLAASFPPPLRNPFPDAAPAPLLLPAGRTFHLPAPCSPGPLAGMGVMSPHITPEQKKRHQLSPANPSGSSGEASGRSFLPSDQAFGQLIQPRQLPAAVTARVKSREALVAALQLDERTALCGMCTSQQSAVGASTQNTLFPVHGTKSALTQKRSTNARRLRLARHTEISARRHRRESVLLPDS